MVITERRGKIRVVTAFDADRNLIAMYLRELGKSMIQKPKIPKFASEAEEAEWWYPNREWLALG